MKLCAYQFPVTGSVAGNLEIIESAIRQASLRKADLLVFPECALTGYPPVSRPESGMDLSSVGDALARIRRLSDETNVACLVGTVAEENGERFDRTVFFSPGEAPDFYDKRILGGWDADLFTPGRRSGVFTLKGVRFAVRICFEVRFPELFREAYRQRCDLCIVPFFDVSGSDDPEYRRIIESHLRSRAAENLFPILSVNATAPYQEAPTLFCDSDGRVLTEAETGKEGMLEAEFGGRVLSPSGERRKLRIDGLAGARTEPGSSADTLTDRFGISPADLEKLILFRLEANRNTYAAYMNETAPTRPASHDFSYAAGDYLYHDTYVGGEQFAGEESVTLGGKALYAMNYLGRVTDSRFSGDFLKEALRNADVSMPYRGPALYQSGAYTYRCAVNGDFTWFQGHEEILCGGDRVYECYFHGGLMK